MTKEEKDLLVNDLSARIHHGVICQVKSGSNEYPLDMKMSDSLWVQFRGSRIMECRPYLRKMPDYWSDDEDAIKLLDFSSRSDYDQLVVTDIGGYYDYLNAHHFDYRGLIEKGLALEAPKGMYNI